MLKWTSSENKTSRGASPPNARDPRSVAGGLHGGCATSGGGQPVTRPNGVESTALLIYAFTPDRRSAPQGNPHKCAAFTHPEEPRSGRC